MLQHLSNEDIELSELIPSILMLRHLALGLHSFPAFQEKVRVIQEIFSQYLCRKFNAHLFPFRF